MSDMMREKGQWEAAQDKVDPNLHLDPKKQYSVDANPREVELQSILDQIARATPKELGVIQKNIATALEGQDPDSLDEATKAKVIATFQRSQELLGVTETPETIH